MRCAVTLTVLGLIADVAVGQLYLAAMFAMIDQWLVASCFGLEGVVALAVVAVRVMRHIPEETR